MTTTYTVTERSYLPAVFAGLVASLVSIGLARFAYTPLLPVMIHSHWFNASQAAFLGAANLAGYLIGALAGRKVARHVLPVTVIRYMTLLASISFFACAFPMSEAWFFCWRLLSGITGGAVMVLVSGVVLQEVPQHKKGLASGAIFLGMGLGVAVSGTLVPVMLAMSLQAAWFALGAMSLALTAATWYLWPAHHNAPPIPAGADKQVKMSRPLKVLFVQYALAAFGLVPMMMFLVDYVSRSLGHGNRLGAIAWIFYGIGAMIGPIAYGMIADRWGPRRTIMVVYFVQIIAVLFLASVNELAAVLFLAVVIGSFPAGMVPLALARLHSLVNEHHVREAMWSKLTVAFAIAQTISGYLYSAVYSWTNGQHEVTFWMAAVSLLAAFIVGRLKNCAL